MALLRSLRSSTICTRKDWRPGMSNALIKPCNAVSAMISQRVMTCARVSAARASDWTAAAACVHTSSLRRLRRSTHTPANGPSANETICPAKPTIAQQQRRMGQAIDQPAGREPRHPGADHRDALTEEEQLEVAVPQRSPGVRHRTSSGTGLPAGSWFAHNSARRLMISPAANRVSCSLFVELGDGLRQPRPLGILGALAHRGAFGGQLDIHLPAVGRMRLALDHAHFLERRDRWRPSTAVSCLRRAPDRRWSPARP